MRLQMPETGDAANREQDCNDGSKDRVVVSGTSCAAPSCAEIELSWRAMMVQKSFSSCLSVKSLHPGAGGHTHIIYRDQSLFCDRGFSGPRPRADVLVGVQKISGRATLFRLQTSRDQAECERFDAGAL